MSGKSWSIYELIDYNNSGRLFDLVNSHKSNQGPNGPDCSRPRWSNLIDEDRKDYGMFSQNQVVDMCRTLSHIISPYLVGHNPSYPQELKISRSFHEQELIQAKRFEKLHNQRFGSVDLKHDNIDATTARRRSWRQRIKSNLKQVNDENRAKKAETFSVDKKSSAGPKQATLVESWIDGAFPSRHHSSARWSESSRHRGKYGESVAHILVINQTEESLFIFILLINLYPPLAADTFKSRKFKDLGCLHLVISAKNEILLNYLLKFSRKHDLNLVDQRVTGSLFCCPVYLKASRDKQSKCRLTTRCRRVCDESEFWCDEMQSWPTANGRSHLILSDRSLIMQNGDSDTNSSSVYLGDSPLAWCVSFNSRSMYEMMVFEGGADQNVQDSNGCTCLHMLAINNQAHWCRFLIKSGVNRETKCVDGLTALLLACKLGRFDIFNELLELSAVEFWSYSSICCCGYPLEGLDSIRVDETDDCKESPSAISVILESHQANNEQKSRLLSSTVIKKLLEEKWRVFAKRLFYNSLFWSLGHLLMLTVAISLRPIRNKSPDRLQFNDSLSTEISLVMWIRSMMLDQYQTTIRHLSEIATVALSMIELVSFAREWFQYRNLSFQMTPKTYNPLLINLVIANLLIALCLPIRLLSMTRLEDILLMFASPLLWSNLLFYVAAFKVTGPFVQMISYMLVRDLRQFSVIFMVFLFAFAQSIFYVNFGTKGPKADDPPETAWGEIYGLFADYSSLWMELFKMTLGVYDIQPYRHSALSRFFFLMFVYLFPILLNTLIAMMNNTYSLIINQSERAFSFQWARTLFALERKLNSKDRTRYLQTYSINMAASKDEKSEDSKTGKFKPALMIINRMNCTRAERRRRVLGCWQRSIKAILNEISNRQGSKKDETI